GRPPPRGPEDIAAELEAFRQFHETLTALRTYYPHDHSRLVETLSDAEQRLGREVLSRETGEFLRDFLTEKAEAIGSASDADLVALAEADLDAARALERMDPRLCAGFVG